MNYKQIGLKTGLEFHQRLDSHKLFCNCKSIQEEKQVMEVIRKLRPVTGELGEVDETTKLEFLRNKTFHYSTFDKSTCLVELDEEPPHEINQEALDIAIEIALLLNADLIDELQVMRKMVIDGSNTSGFQRTSMISNKGFLKSIKGNIPISGIFLEEESAGVINEKKEVKKYRLDRLGIPLVEIATGIMEFEPEEVQEIALELGKLLRITGKVQRGLGTIRQDVNISIKQGARVEAKGLQDIKLLAKVIKLEVQRQLNLLKLKELLLSKNLKPKIYEIQSFTRIFTNTKNKLIRNALKKQEKVYGMVLPNFKGLLGFELCENYRFGTELAGIAKTFGLKGVIHSDEDLSKYEIEKEVNEIIKEHNLKQQDAIILIVGKPHALTNALTKINERINLAFEKIPNETRKVMPDGTTQFMRYISGEHRMYPETDVPPVLITKERIEKIRKQLPKEPEKLKQELIKKGIKEDYAERILTSKNLQLILKLINKYKQSKKISPVLIVITIEETLTELKRQGYDVSKINEKKLINLFDLIEKGLPKEAIQEKLIYLIKNEEIKSDEVEIITEEKLIRYLEAIIKTKSINLSDKRKAFKILMGEMMKKFRGKADGSLIAKIVNQKLS